MKPRWTTHADLAIKKPMNVRREETLDHMTFRANTRPLFTESFGPIIGLKEAWHAQGASDAELDMSAHRYRCPAFGGVPVSTGWMGGPAGEVLEETEKVLITRDRMGRTMRLEKGFATLSLPQDWPVATMDDWLRVRSHYEFSEERLTNDWEAAAIAHREAGRVVTVGIPGGFGQPRQLMGEARLCEAYYDAPELVHDILDTIGETAFRVLERVSRVVPIDQLSVHEDMAGKSGPLAGPVQLREFIAPYYRRIWDMLQERRARLFDQDSDGDMNPVIPAFLDAGVNVMHPMEAAANMDIVEAPATYGERLAFYGGLDKHVIRRSKEEIVAELEAKNPVIVRTGGCVLALDHRIPNGTPLDNYRFYVDKAWEIMEREARLL